MKSRGKAGSSAISLVLAFCLAVGSATVTTLTTGCGVLPGTIVDCAQRALELQQLVAAGDEVDLCRGIDLTIEAIDVGCYETLLPIVTILANRIGQDTSNLPSDINEARLLLEQAKVLLCS